jgi:hypothetical protein
LPIVGWRRPPCGLGEYLLVVTEVDPPAPAPPGQRPAQHGWAPDVKQWADPVDAPAVRESWLPDADTEGTP